MKQKQSRLSLAVGPVGVSIMLLGAFVPPVLADGFRNPPDGAAVLGRVGGRIAQVDDATAVAHNPANMADLKQPSVLGSVNFGYVEKDYDSPAGESTTTEDPARALPSVFAVAPLSAGGHSVVAGVGVNMPFGQSTRWSKTSTPGMAGPYFSEMMTVGVNPSIAVKVLPSLSVGVGFDLYWSQLTLRQSLPWAMVTGMPAAPSGVASFEGDGYGYGYNAGATWQITKRQRLALTYRSGFDVEYDGDFEATRMPPPVAALGITPKSDFESEFSFPSVAALGYGVALSDTVRVEADVEWVQHSAFDEVTLDIGNNNALAAQPATGSNTLPMDWDDTWTFGLGGDWQFAPSWMARAGYAFMPTPVPEKTLIPSVSEGDQHVLSTGLGYRNGGHAVDLALAYGIIDSRKVDENLNPAFNGDYDFRSTLVGVSYAYSF